jgi:hypothetical protein
MGAIMTLDEIAIECGTDKSSLEHNYTPIYERHFEHLRNNNLRLLEIGVDKGYSLRMWSKYFLQAYIYGLDINPISPLNIERVMVLQGNQADQESLKGTHNVFGPFDIIIDDGSHCNPHMRISFDTLFPLLKSGGTYVVEDLHCCYWTNTGHPIFTDYLKNFIGPMLNFGHTNRPGEAPYFDMTYAEPSQFDKMIKSIEFYKGIVFITKV